MGEPDTIVVISPGYMNAVIACLSRYKQVLIAGYSDIEKGIRTLYRIPGSRIIGFCYLNDYIRAKDVNGLRQLLHKANILFEGVYDDAGSKPPFLFLLSTNLGGKLGGLDYVKELTSNCSCSNLSIGYYNYQVVTDVLIKVQLFGTILLRSHPFEIQYQEKVLTRNNTKQLSLELPFDTKWIDVFSPLSFVEVDDFFQKYKEDKVICFIRTYFYTLSDSLLEAIYAEIKKFSGEDRIMYEACLRNFDLVRRKKL